MEERLRSHYESLSRALAFTRAADAKAAPVLALQVAILGALAARFERLIPALLATAARVYIPVNPPAGGSLVYFEDIAATSREQFARRAREVSPDTIEEQLFGQIHTVSKIAGLKMRRVRRAFRLSGPPLAARLWSHSSGLGQGAVIPTLIAVTACETQVAQVDCADPEEGISMNCSIQGCPGEYEAGALVHTVRHKGRIVVIDHVPADICSLCGDALLNPDTVRRIEDLLTEKGQPAMTAPLFEFV